MSGLIQQQMDPEAPAADQVPPAAAPEDTAPTPDDAGTEEVGELTITPQSMLAKMHLQPGQAQQLQGIVAAGMKVMFSKQTRQMITQELQKPGDMASKLGESVAGLIGLLLQESKNSMSPQLIVPAGIVLVAHAAEFVKQIGMEVTDKDVGDAVQIFIHVVLHQNGVDSDKVAAQGEQALQQQGAQAVGAPAPEQAAAPSGLVAGQMGAPQ